MDEHTASSRGGSLDQAPASASSTSAPSPPAIGDHSSHDASAQNQELLSDRVKTSSHRSLPTKLQDARTAGELIRRRDAARGDAASSGSGAASSGGGGGSSSSTASAGTASAGGGAVAEGAGSAAPVRTTSTSGRPAGAAPSGRPPTNPGGGNSRNKTKTASEHVGGRGGPSGKVRPGGVSSLPVIEVCFTDEGFTAEFPDDGNGLLPKDMCDTGATVTIGAPSVVQHGGVEDFAHDTRGQTYYLHRISEERSRMLEDEEGATSTTPLHHGGGGGTCSPTGTTGGERIVLEEGSDCQGDRRLPWENVAHAGATGRHQFSGGLISPTPPTAEIGPISDGVVKNDSPSDVKNDSNLDEYEDDFEEDEDDEPRPDIRLSSGGAECSPPSSLSRGGDQALSSDGGGPPPTLRVTTQLDHQHRSAGSSSYQTGPPSSQLHLYHTVKEPPNFSSDGGKDPRTTQHAPETSGNHDASPPTASPTTLYPSGSPASQTDSAGSAASSSGSGTSMKTRQIYTSKAASLQTYLEGQIGFLVYEKCYEIIRNAGEQDRTVQDRVRKILGSKKCTQLFPLLQLVCLLQDIAGTDS